MTTLEHRPNTALLVVDVQTGVVEAAHDRDTVVANIAALGHDSWIIAACGGPRRLAQAGPAPCARPAHPRR